MKTPDIKNRLGLTQEEMAMHLGISLSQWKMFKSGKRSLPLQALENFSVLLKGVQQKKDSSTEAQGLRKTEEEQAKGKRQHAYLKVQVKLQRLEKEIAVIENQRAESFAALETAFFLEGQKEGKANKDFIQSIRSRALTTLKKQSLYKREALQLQKENLEMLKLEIGKKMAAEEK
ncbi:helix-turn-helix domain-containing protein [Flavobacterium saliperosum]|uniref:Uncharacterized protein n=2 Tax=Flavobacterium saliperosum TaxID=329186 RepID=A0A1G4VMQ1_9FLAO|nr:helix-turn-helix domain-containing protein [Flavobacterium saliperosum]SCX09128.1 hypothetical protein SAMN02927925_01334 [Flavobacterium saliperosum]